MADIIKVSPDAPTAQVGFGIKTGGIITSAMIAAGQNVTDANGNLVTFKLLHIGNGGSLVVRGVDGGIYAIRNVVSGGWVPAWGTAILASGTINGQLITTDADNIDWYSGL